MMAQPLTIRLPGKPTAVRVVGTGAAAAAAAQQAQPRPAQKTQADLQAQAQVQQALAALNEAAAKLQQMQQQLVKEAEQQLLDLSVDIARKVLMQEIQAQRYEIDPIVKEALGRVPVRSQVVVYLNPEDLSRCQLAQQKDDGRGGSVHFVGDPSIARAHCLLEASEGVVTSNVDERLEDIELALKSL